MRHFVILCCVLATVLAKDKKISLEDIERDSLKSEKLPRTLQKNASPTTYGFLPVKTVQDYARQQPQQYLQYLPKERYSSPAQQYTSPAQQYTSPAQQYSTPAQQYSTPAQQYYYQQQQPSQYQQYENIQYITDNSLGQQQYYTPQYVYLQQYTAPSTAVQSVVDPKGGVQYVMYVPAYVPKAEQNVVYATEQAYASPETQYVAQQQEATPSIKYAEQPPQQETMAPIYKKEPKSLLDSYVPSILQYQYYKQQQQARANAIQQSLKERTKTSHKPSQTQHSSAESVVNYNYQTPGTYQQYN